MGGRAEYSRTSLQERMKQRNKHQDSAPNAVSGLRLGGRGCGRSQAATGRVGAHSFTHSFSKSALTSGTCPHQGAEAITIRGLGVITGRLPESGIQRRFLEGEALRLGFKEGAGRSGVTQGGGVGKGPSRFLCGTTDGTVPTPDPTLTSLSFSCSP